MSVNKNFKILSYLLILIILILFDFLITNIFIISKNKLIGNLTIKHSIFHHTLKPNSEGGGFINEKYYTNSLGFRDFSIRNINNETKKKKNITHGRFSSDGIT